jgi:DNA polymerase-3 subunit gamma/tau
MSHKSSPAAAVSEALYRKYRPEVWAEVIGQDHIVSVLQASLKRGAIFHAYLFSGTRGTGKTTVARIVAREVGAESADIVEIDAASNRGIDDIRALKESVDTLPFSSPYKVYIIDEVHMLTKEAFNALLKTLEEPPRHVIFILATTELDKIPDTIVSRCQTFTFKKPNQTILRQLIMKTAKAEGVSIDADAADLIALLGDGSFRDTHGMLQKVISFSADKRITGQEVATITGAPARTLVHDFLTALGQGNTAGALTAIAQAVAQNSDMRAFAKLVLRSVRAMLLVRAAPDMEKIVAEELGEDEFVFIKNLSSTGTKITSRTLADLLTAYEAMTRSFAPHIPLELAVLQVAK